MKDELFSREKPRASDFEFNAEVARVFDDMLNRSIPFYSEVQTMIVNLIRQFIQPGAQVYDIGCSTGSMIARIAMELPSVAKIIGIDNSEPMLQKAAEQLARLDLIPEVQLLIGDTRNFPFQPADAIVMNYTLQFVRPLYRERVLRRIFEALKPGGIFLLSEKVLEDGTAISRLFVDVYYDFKRQQGYSELEISRKRETLENVLIPYKVSEHYELMRSCGFEEVEIFFKWHNFASFIGIKRL